VRRIPHIEITQAAAIVNATCSLIGYCIAAAPKLQDVDPRSRDVAIRHRVFHYIDGHLGTPNLTRAKICNEVGISRSVLYRAFALLGGIADLLRARRLEAAHPRWKNPRSVVIFWISPASSVLSATHISAEVFASATATIRAGHATAKPMDFAIWRQCRCLRRG
jgi:AraC-like DNA-binding protein